MYTYVYVYIYIYIYILQYNMMCVYMCNKLMVITTIILGPHKPTLPPPPLFTINVNSDFLTVTTD